MSDFFDPEPALEALRALGGEIGRLRWFAELGAPMDEAARALARQYAAALGFPEAELAQIPDWAEAELVAVNPDWNTPSWEAEEQLRASLTAAALERITDDMLTATLDHIAAIAAQVIPDAARDAAAFDEVTDEALIRAAAGAAIQACHQKALCLLADAGPEHPFALRFALFAAGRWPICIAGGSFHVF